MDSFLFKIITLDGLFLINELEIGLLKVKIPVRVHELPQEHSHLFLVNLPVAVLVDFFVDSADLLLCQRWLCHVL